jgi:tetratricopeptide (TPR) repeat protein
MAEVLQNLLEDGVRARAEGRVANSRQIFLDVVRHASAVNDQASLAAAFCGLAQAEVDIGNCDAAQHQYALAATLYRRIGPPERLAYAVRHEADVLRKLKKFEEARGLYLAAETIYRQQTPEPTLDLANTLRGLALLDEVSGGAGEAIALWRQARELYAKANVPAGVEESDWKILGASPKQE